MLDVWSNLSSTSILHVRKQGRLLQDCSGIDKHAGALAVHLYKKYYDFTDLSSHIIIWAYAYTNSKGADQPVCIHTV